MGRLFWQGGKGKVEVKGKVKGEVKVKVKVKGKGKGKGTKGIRMQSLPQEIFAAKGVNVRCEEAPLVG